MTMQQCLSAETIYIRLYWANKSVCAASHLADTKCRIENAKCFCDWQQIVLRAIFAVALCAATHSHQCRSRCLSAVVWPNANFHFSLQRIDVFLPIIIFHAFVLVLLCVGQAIEQCVRLFIRQWTQIRNQHIRRMYFFIIRQAKEYRQVASTSLLLFPMDFFHRSLTFLFFFNLTAFFSDFETGKTENSFCESCQRKWSRVNTKNMAKRMNKWARFVVTTRWNKVM